MKFPLTRFILISLFIYTTASLLPKLAFAASLEIPNAQSAIGFAIKYFDLEDKCYSLQIRDPNGNFVHIKSDSSFQSCTNNNNNYLSAKPVKVNDELKPNGAWFIEGQPAGIYQISLYQGQALLTQKNITITESGITPTALPTAKPTAQPFNCDNRPPSCSKDKYPQCKVTTTNDVCGSKDYSCTFNSGTTGRLCAYPANVTMPPVRTDNSCNQTHIENGKIVGGKCAPGWKQSTGGGLPNCVCIPENAPKPTPSQEELNSCPVCGPDFPNFLQTTGACHKDSGTNSDNTFPEEYEQCSPDACTPGEGCSSEGTFQCPVCAPPEGSAVTRLYYNPNDKSCYSNSNFLGDPSSPPTTVSCTKQECQPGIGCAIKPPPAVPPCKVAYKYERDLETGDITNPIPTLFPISEGTEGEDLEAIMGTADGCWTVDTAIGGIGANPSEFLKNFMGILLSLSGGIALILIMISGYQIMTSRGDPEKIQGAKDRLTSAIVGLLFIIFSLVIIEIIGVDILRIPGFE